MEIGEIIGKKYYNEARYEEVLSKNILFKNGVIEGIEFSKTKGVGIRVLKNNLLLFYSTNKINKKEIEKIKNFKINFQNIRQVHFSKEKQTKAKYSIKEKKKIENVDEKEILEIVKYLDSIFVEEGIKNRFVILSLTRRKQEFENSEGSRIVSYVPRILLSYLITIKERRTIQRYSDIGFCAGLEKIGSNIFEKIREETKELKEVAKNGKRIGSTKTNVLLSSELTGIAVHESIGHPCEADRIIGREAAQAGESYLKPKKFRIRIGNELVNVADDPTLKEYGFFLYDDEGVKARRKILVKKGIINELLLNRETAFELKTKSNGSARASSYNVEPIVRMSNTFLLPGDLSFDELVEEAKNGVFIKTFMEWNIDDLRINQRYTGGIAYAIRNSRIEEPVIFPVIETTTFNFWKSVKAIAKDLEFKAATCGKGEPMQGIPVTTGGPSILLQKVKVWSR
ncbi:MAG: TldD/PmbA family protein [Candidatus Micrarchaeia archaeon]